MSEIEIGRGKRGRRAYTFDDIAVVPSRRTRDPEDVSTSWQIDAYHFDIPVLAAPMDSVMSPATAIAFGQAGGLPVLDLEGLWTRYADPEPLLATGRWAGEILHAPRGAGGFGYDPLVFLPAQQATVAELDAATKNRLSHRAQAAARLRERLREDWLLG